MIYIRMRNYIYDKEIFELVRAFYPGDEIKESDKAIDSGIFVDFTIEDSHDGKYGITRVFVDTSLKSLSRVKLDNIYINRNIDKTIKLGVKKSLYLALEDFTKKRLPWGVLTGIRPVKIVRRLLEKNTPMDMIENILVNEYILDVDKAKLIINIAREQKDYIYPMDKDRYSLYIGIPFCPTRCTYCSFASLPIDRYRPYVDEYIEKLIYEIRVTGDLLKDKKLNTVYIGGGTPTSIPVNSLDRIIKSLYENFEMDAIKEFTVEAGRPETINKDMLKMLKSHKVDRISINPQTMNDRTLKLIGRNHSSEDIIKAYSMAKDIGFKTINMDIILGLADEDLKDMEYTLSEISKLDPENLTVHSLAIKKGSKYGDSGDKKYLNNILMAESMMDLSKEYCQSNAYIPYYLYRQKQILGNLENIGYAKDKHNCIYNIAIMEERESIIGVGLGATSKLYNPEDDSIERIFNFKDLKSYLERNDEIIDRKRKGLI